MLLRDLLSGVHCVGGLGPLSANPDISTLTNSSKDVRPNCLFIALRGSKLDARDYIKQAVDNGATAVLTSKDDYDWQNVQGLSCPLIFAADIAWAKAQVAKNFYLQGSDIDCYIGVTGTNGKTSICWLLSEALSVLRCRAAYLGTIGFSLFDDRGQVQKSVKTNTTTEDALSVYQFLGETKQEGVRAAVLEVSSHALDQKRHGAIAWQGTVFTNLTRDHLDYHGTMENYAAAKKRLFFCELAQSAKEGRFAVINVDDACGREIKEQLSREYPEIKVLGYSMTDQTQAVCVDHYKPGMCGTEIRAIVNGKCISWNNNLVGNFNVSNSLAVVGVLCGLGYDATDIAQALSLVCPVPGRLERIASDEIGVYVDYAHTPDGLVRAQESLREICPGRLITVFGCGGDRDRGKRPIMGQEVMRLSDLAVVTSDNPRTEDPEKIIADILVGLRDKRAGFEYTIQVDRRRAIREAMRLAKKGDIVLIAGKGHEDYQDVGGKKHHFSDQEECCAAIAERRQ